MVPCTSVQPVTSVLLENKPGSPYIHKRLWWGLHTSTPLKGFGSTLRNNSNRKYYPCNNCFWVTSVWITLHKAIIYSSELTGLHLGTDYLSNSGNLNYLHCQTIKPLVLLRQTHAKEKDLLRMINDPQVPLTLLLMCKSIRGSGKCLKISWSILVLPSPLSRGGKLSTSGATEKQLSGMNVQSQHMRDDQEPDQKCVKTSGYR